MIWPTAGQASRISFVIVVWMERTLRVSPVPRLPHYGGVAFELRTPLCELLGIAYPVLSVGFDAGARAELVAAVSNAGGFGVLGASELPPGALRAEIERTRTLTDSPFAINLTDFDEDHEFVRLQISTAAEAGATAVVLFWGDPAPFVAQAHAAGVFVLIQVGSVEEAESAVDAGVDAVIVQGEAPRV
jgi:nitronate monooxygenase